jgi:ABC-type Na+ efflux pump, permease component
MNLSKAWVIASKDLATIQKNKQILYSLLIIAIATSILFPLILFTSSSSVSPNGLIGMAISLANTNALLFILIAAEVPAIIGSYSIVGEKIEKSLEPLLATPTTDEELLIGKNLATLIPSISATLICSAISISLFELWSIINVGRLFLPSNYWLMTVFLLAPLACILSVETCIIISAKVSDIRAAQQLCTLVSLPLILLAIFGLLETSIVSVAIIVILVVVDIALFYVSKAMFQREEILTKWK